MGNMGAVRRERIMIPLKDDNPTRITPFVSWTFLGACILVFLWQLSLGPRGGQAAVFALGVIPSVLFGIKELPPNLELVPPLATMFTSMFLHGGFFHLAGNMLYLWIFADNVEESVGHFRFIVFYFLCGIAAVLAQALPAPESDIPMIGASGAISGVLGAYLLLFPHARIVVLIPFGFLSQVVMLPAIWVLGLWFGIQFFSELAAGDGAGVAFRAHIGGFIAGMVLLPLMKRRGVRLFSRGRASPRRR